MIIETKIDKIKLIFNLFTLFFSLILIIDMLSGVNVTKETLKSNERYTQSTGYLGRGSSSTTILGIKTNKNEYPITNVSLYNNLKKGDNIQTYKTKIFGEVLKIKHKNTIYEDPSYSIYKLYNLFPISCIIFSLFSILAYNYKREYLDFFIILSVILTIYLSISMITNNII